MAWLLEKDLQFPPGPVETPSRWHSSQNESVYHRQEVKPCKPWPVAGQTPENQTRNGCVAGGTPGRSAFRERSLVFPPN